MDAAPEPYASVIVPTHDRASTLDIALESIRAQSVENIEIIVALDGATAQVRELALAIAARDARVRVLDLPKADGRGSANRDLALEAARAERIFYSDDDDLWLPHHVATLGPMLDEHDIVYSPVLSLSLSGDVHTIFVDYAIPELRRSLGEAKLKVTFDTHIAHRRSRYFELGRPWAVDTNRVVYNLLSAFTDASHIRWAAASAPTALSVHGAARRYCSDDARRRELALWSPRVRNDNVEDILRRSRVEWYMQRCLRMLPPAPDETLNDYAARLGYALSEDVAEQRGLPLAPYTQAQCNAMQAAFDLGRGHAPPEDQLTDSIPHLLDPLLGYMPHVWEVIVQLEGAFGRERACVLAQGFRPSDPRLFELCRLLEGRLLLRARKAAEARTIARAIIDSGAFYPAEAEHLASAVEAAEGAGEAALTHAERAAERAPWSVSMRTALGMAQIQAGLIAEARATRAFARTLTDDERPLARLDEALRAYD